MSPLQWRQLVISVLGLGLMFCVGAVVYNVGLELGPPALLFCRRQLGSGVTVETGAGAIAEQPV